MACVAKGGKIQHGLEHVYKELPCRVMMSWSYVVTGGKSVRGALREHASAGAVLRTCGDEPGPSLYSPPLHLAYC